MERLHFCVTLKHLPRQECWREDLEPISKRRLAVLDPLEVAPWCKHLKRAHQTQAQSVSSRGKSLQLFQEITDYDKEETIEGVTDLPDQSATADPSCARTLSSLDQVTSQLSLVVKSSWRSGIKS